MTLEFAKRISVFDEIYAKTRLPIAYQSEIHWVYGFSVADKAVGLHFTMQKDDVCEWYRHLFCGIHECTVYVETVKRYPLSKTIGFSKIKQWTSDTLAGEKRKLNAEKERENYPGEAIANYYRKIYGIPKTDPITVTRGEDGSIYLHDDGCR